MTTDPTLAVGVAGVAGSGKDTVATYLQSNYSFTRRAFADPLKEVCAALFGIPIVNFYDRSVKECTNPYWDLSPRQIAQIIGTEVVRDNLGEDHWIKLLEYSLLQKPVNRLVVSDVRFQNEIQYLTSKPNGFIIHLLRPGFAAVNSHISDQTESLSYDMQWTYQVFNEGTIAELHESIDEVMTRIIERVAGSILSDSTSHVNSVTGIGSSSSSDC